MERGEDTADARTQAAGGLPLHTSIVRSCPRAAAVGSRPPALGTIRALSFPELDCELDATDSRAPHR